MAGRTIFRFQPTRENDWTLKLGYSQNRAMARQLQHLSVAETAGRFQFGNDDAGGYIDYDNTTCFRVPGRRGCILPPGIKHSRCPPKSVSEGWRNAKSTSGGRTSGGPGKGMIHGRAGHEEDR